MRRAECVVYVYLSKRRQPARKFGIVTLFARMKPQVLQRQNSPRRKRCRRRRNLILPDALPRLTYRRSQKFA